MMRTLFIRYSAVISFLLVVSLAATQAQTLDDKTSALASPRADETPTPSTTPPSNPPLISTSEYTTPATASTAVSGMMLEKVDAVDKPIEAATLGDIDPQSIGLISGSTDGLGTAMWKGTDRALVEALLPSLALPLTSPTLNALAERLLLTTASAPTGHGSQSLVALRVDRLLSLGDVADAWKLAMLAKPGLVDDATLRRTVTDLLATNSGDVCSKLPNLLKNNGVPDWQKLLVICQLRDNDTKAAQLTLDLLHSEDVKDELFFTLAEKNLLGGNQQLPRTLAPLKPLNFSLLSMIALPLPSDVYSHPPASLISNLIQSKARDDSARLALAERAAAEGIVASASLSLAYHGLSFSTDILTNPLVNTGSDEPKNRALLYQAALQEKNFQKRIDDTLQFIHITDATLLKGNVVPLLAEMVGDTTISTDTAPLSVSLARIYLTAGKREAAFECLKQAQAQSASDPVVSQELIELWPLVVFSGLETDDKFAGDLKEWLNTTLKQDNSRNNHERIASLLLLLEATGYAVAQENWVKVMDPLISEKWVVPPALLLEKFREASTNGRRGETVLLSLLLASVGTNNEVSPFVIIETVHALRLVGLTNDAASLAHEAANLFLASNTTKRGDEKN